MLKSVGLLLVLSLLHIAQGVVWRDCGSVNGKILSFKAENCHQRHRCDLSPGTNQTVEMTFQSLTNSHTLTVEAYSIIGGRMSKFSLPNRDVCRSDLTCPLVKNEEYTYHTTIYIDPKFPRVAMVVKWELKDDNNKDIVCIMVPAKIL